MEKLGVISVIILLILSGCSENKQSTDGIITVDVTASYPKKELILQDFMDVEYVALETNDEFVTQGVVQVVGKDIIVVTNRIPNGDIFIFDRNGKAIKKINRFGQGGEEYTGILGISLDEDKNELFVNDYSARKIIVYDFHGNYKRSFKHKKDAGYDFVYNFDEKNLICHDGYFSYDSNGSERPFLVVSKEDGTVAREIQIPFEKKIITKLMVRSEDDMVFTGGPSTEIPIIPYFDNWILMEASSDTIYSYSPDHAMTPFIIRTPSIQSMNPEVFLFPHNFTERFCFMVTVKKEYDFDKRTGFPVTELLYDKEEKTIFTYTVYNDDFSSKEIVSMWARPVNSEIAICKSLEAYLLVEAYNEGKLKGKLKEIASELNEDSNPVIMLAK